MRMKNWENSITSIFWYSTKGNISFFQKDGIEYAFVSGNSDLRLGHFDMMTGVGYIYPRPLWV